MQNFEDSKIETLHKLLDGKAEAVEFRVSKEADILGKPLKDFKFKPQILIACIVRHGAAIIADGNTVIEEGDNVIVISGRKALNSIEEILL
jgi:trk system potassium uptake protein TrkA